MNRASPKFNLRSMTSDSASNQSSFDYDSSIYSNETTGNGMEAQPSKPRWISSVKSWLSVSEPSAQAMKEQKRSTYKRFGINPKDPQAAAKMHFPLGKVPEGVTTSTTGPTPEKLLKEQAKRKKKTRQPSQSSIQSSRIISSSASLAPSSTNSTKVPSRIAPWEE